MMDDCRCGLLVNTAVLTRFFQWQKQQLTKAWNTWYMKLAKFAPEIPSFGNVDGPKPPTIEARYSAYVPPKKIPAPVDAEARLGYSLGDIPVHHKDRGLSNPRAVLVSQHYPRY